MEQWETEGVIKLFNANLFKYVQLLRDKYYTELQFNLFSVLRSDSDEVRLHSRFIAEVLNPNGSHYSDDVFLICFLELLEISLEPDVQPLVFTEYKNIDILIKIGDTAVIIENKIFAGDQNEQLTRYYESIKSEGFKDIYLVYLTLNGTEPSNQSVKGIDESFLNSNKFHCLSYKDEIYKWVDRCLSISAMKPALRESFAQYLEVIEKLTQKVINYKYMDELKELLRKDKNIINFLDLQQAFNSVVVDLQVDLWKRIQNALEPLLGKPSGNSFLTEEQKIDSVKRFMDGRKNSSYFGLFYPVKDSPHQFAIEMQGNGIIAGINCSEEKYPKEYNNIVKILGNGSGCSRSKSWPQYRYIEPHIHYKNLTSENLVTLTSENMRKKIADETANYIKSVLSVMDCTNSHAQ